jgi:cell division protein ZapA
LGYRLPTKYSDDEALEFVIVRELRIWRRLFDGDDCVLGKISITIQKRAYRLSCGEGEEARLKELAEHVRAKANQLVAEHGRIGDEDLLLMSAILIADELWDERAEQQSAEKKSAASGRGQGRTKDGAEAA